MQIILQGSSMFINFGKTARVISRGSIDEVENCDKKNIDVINYRKPYLFTFDMHTILCRRA